MCGIQMEKIKWADFNCRVLMCFAMWLIAAELVIIKKKPTQVFKKNIFTLCAFDKKKSNLKPFK